jgi:hypothetical protein
MKKLATQELEHEQRCASLIRRWLGGKKLSDEEKTFVAEHGHIPVEILTAGPSSPGAREAVSETAARLGPLNTRKHVKYQKKLPEYQSTYETGDRGLRYWLRRGKLLGKPPPFDHPEKMADWWRQCMDHEVPDKLLAYEKLPDPHAANGDARSTNGETGEAKAKDYSNVTSLDIAENVEALRRTHAINKRQLDEALSGVNETEIQLRQKNFERSFELLRKGELALVQIQKERGKLIDEESVRVELAQLLESLRLMRETMPKRIITELERILPRRFQRVLRALEKYLTPAVEKVRASEDEIFRNLETVKNSEAILQLLGQ